MSQSHTFILSIKNIEILKIFTIQYISILVIIFLKNIKYYFLCLSSQFKYSN